MGRALALVLLIGSITVLAGCGGSDGPASKPASTSTNSLAETCAAYSGMTAAACEHSYFSCAREAPRQVRLYHDDEGPRLDVIAEEATFPGRREPARHGAFAGCLAALTDAYNREFG